MNIQIFGKSKCFDTKKAQRFFKERRIKVQYIDLLQKGFSRGEYLSVKRACGGELALLDERSADAAVLKYLEREDDRDERMLADPSLFKTPVVRNGRAATVGYCPDVWEQWIRSGTE